MLEALVAMDENSGSLGEVALVDYHSPISMSGIVYYCTTTPCLMKMLPAIWLWAAPLAVRCRRTALGPSTMP